MVVECVAIVLVLFGIVGAFLRAKKRSYALATLPLFFVPVGYLLSTVVSGKMSGMTLGVFRITWVLFGLVCSCLMLGVLSAQMKSKKRRYIYLVTSGVFLLGLTSIIAFRIMEALF